MGERRKGGRKDRVGSARRRAQSSGRRAGDEEVGNLSYFLPFAFDSFPFLCLITVPSLARAGRGSDNTESRSRRRRRGSERGRRKGFFVTSASSFAIEDIGGVGPGPEAQAKIRKKVFTGFVDNVALGEKVGEGVLAGPTVETGGHLVQTLVVLMSHAARGGKGVVDKRHVENEEGLGGMGQTLQILGHGSEKIERGSGRKTGLVDLEKVGNFFTDLVGRVIEVNIVDQNFVDLGADRGRKGDQPAVGEVATTPKIDRSRISVVADVHIDPDVKVGEQVVVGGGVMEKGGTERPTGKC